MPWLHYSFIAAPAPAPGPGMDAAWIAALTGATVAVITAAGWVARRLVRLIRETSHFFAEWKGEPSRTGVPERPGVMERLESLTGEVAKVRDEVLPNKGGSLRDAVDRVETGLAEHRRLTSPAIRQLTADVADLRRRIAFVEHDDDPGGPGG